MGPGDDQEVPVSHRIDIREGERFVVFEYAGRRDLPVPNPAKDTLHRPTSGNGLPGNHEY